MACDVDWFDGEVVILYRVLDDRHMPLQPVRSPLRCLFRWKVFLRSLWATLIRLNTTLRVKH